MFCPISYHDAEFRDACQLTDSFHAVSAKLEDIGLHVSTGPQAGLMDSLLLYY